MKLEEAGAKSGAECFDSKALYDSMLKILDRLLLEKLEEKQVKILDIEIEKRVEIVRKLLVQNTGIDSLELQEINCKDMRLLNENEVHYPVHCKTEQVTEACKNDWNVHIIPSLNFNNEVHGSLIFHDEVKQKKLQDEGTLKEKLKQGRSDLFDVKMENSASKNAVQGTNKIKLKVAQVSQPQIDQEIQVTRDTRVTQRRLKPEWLGNFFTRTFFNSCSKHPIRRNDKNKYCIDCNASLCQYCLSLASHSGHRLLKIYRHVYKDVVPVHQIQRHIDISKIQPYRCNRQMVVALSPLPHTGSGKTSGEATCLTCQRKLIESHVYNYCSITCKVEAFMKKESDSVPPYLSLDGPEESPKEESPSKKTRKRKGIPRRAPFF